MTNFCGTFDIIDRQNEIAIKAVDVEITSTLIQESERYTSELMKQFTKNWFEEEIERMKSAFLAQGVTEEVRVWGKKVNGQWVRPLCRILSSVHLDGTPDQYVVTWIPSEPLDFQI